MSQDDDRITYGQRVWQAYQTIAAERQSLDIPIAELHRRVGGDIWELHDHLRSECLAHHAVVSTGEPAFASDEAKRTALTLPGERDTFLNVKLIESPAMTQDQQQQPKPSFVVPSPVEQYEYHLRQLAALRYPAEERTAELQARIEKTIARKVGEFTQERQAKAYEAGLRKELAQRHPNLTPAQAQHYEQRIAKLVADFRQNQAQQQAQTPADRSQEQGRGIER
jgi:hypothetical protein